MPEKYRRPAADPLHAENAKLRRELEEVRTAMPRIDLEFAEGGKVLKVEQTTPRITSNRRERSSLYLRKLSLEKLPYLYEVELEKPTQAEVTLSTNNSKSFGPNTKNMQPNRTLLSSFLTGRLARSSFCVTLEGDPLRASNRYSNSPLVLVSSAKQTSQMSPQCQSDQSCRDEDAASVLLLIWLLPQFFQRGSITATFSPSP